MSRYPSVHIEVSFQMVCTFVAVALHYFFLASFMWMLVEGIYLVLRVRKVLQPINNLRIAYVLAYGKSVVVIYGRKLRIKKYIVCVAISEDSYAWEILVLEEKARDPSKCSVIKVRSTDRPALYPGLVTWHTLFQDQVYYETVSRVLGGGWSYISDYVRAVGAFTEKTFSYAPAGTVRYSRPKIKIPLKIVG